MQKYYKVLRFEKKFPFFLEIWNMFDFWNVADKIELMCPNPLIWVSLEPSLHAEHLCTKFFKFDNAIVKKVQFYEF